MSDPIISTDIENAVSDPQQLADLAAEGERLYSEKIGPLLEPDQNGSSVAIHLPTGDFAVAQNAPAALRALHARHPDGMVMTRTVGPEHPDDPFLDRLASSLRRAGGK